MPSTEANIALELITLRPRPEIKSQMLNGATQRPLYLNFIPYLFSCQVISQKHLNIVNFTWINLMLIYRLKLSMQYWNEMVIEGILGLLLTFRVMLLLFTID